MKKTWGGRFKKKSAKLLDEFNSSLTFDKKLYKEDIEGSMAYAKALCKGNVISNKELNQITKGLNKIEKEIKKDGEKWFVKNNNEDIHSAIESRLIKLTGDAGRKLHTGRSRNDQVVTDTRLYLKKEIKEILNLTKSLRFTFLKLARKHYKWIMPGYTHLQKAQPITLGHYLLAQQEKLKRDMERFSESLKRTDIMPLGSGALSGSSFKIDRKFLAKKLNFLKISENSLDAVSDRDFVCEFLFNTCLLNIHLSQLAEDLILWNSSEFGFICISDAYATGSSLMPQKKNPDILELVRGKTGRLIGNLTGILTLLKGLPSAYNKDLQEDKELIFDSSSSIKLILQITDELLKNISFNKEKTYKAASSDFLNATDVADYLTKKSIPFRKAHEIVGKIILYCIRKKKELQDLNIDEWKSFNKLFNADILEKIKIEYCVNSKKSYGGTSPGEILKAIKRSK